MLHRADCADFGCHNSIRLETEHFLNTLALTFISFSGRFVFAMQKHYPLGGGHIIFAFSAVRRPTWFPDILANSSYPIFTKFGMQVYWVNSLYGIAFGDDSSIAN